MHGSAANRWFPVSFEQQLLLDNAEEKPPSHYNIVYGYHLPGPSDPDVYTSAVRRVAAAHDSLRTIFRTDGPRKYGTGLSGRRAPAHFSRAVGVLGRTDHWVLVAGTASVVGSSTANIDAVSGQTTQTLANLSTLAAEARRKQGTGAQAVPISDAYQNLVVYLTCAEHFDAVRRSLDTVARDIPVTYLRCPLTRTDLLVEMEGELA